MAFRTYNFMGAETMTIGREEVYSAVVEGAGVIP